MRKPQAPFFEIGVKNYLYGDQVLKLALAADRAAIQYDVDVLMITPYTEIRRVAEQTNRLIVLAPYMDVEPPGRGLANVLPEALKAAGAKGVVVNHCERPMTLGAVQETIRRAKALDMLVFACAGSLEEAQAMAHFHPHIINPEPSALIGTGQVSGMDFMRESTRAVKAIAPQTLVEHAAGITSAEQVYELVMEGAEGVGVASGIMCALDPKKMAENMVRSVRLAWDDRQRGKGEGYLGNIS